MEVPDQESVELLPELQPTPWLWQWQMPNPLCHMGTSCGSSLMFLVCSVKWEGRSSAENEDEEGGV